MAYFEDMPLKDIALSTGESLGNVRHHYYRALRRLRSLFLQGDAGRTNNRTREAQFEIMRGMLMWKLESFNYKFKKSDPMRISSDEHHQIIEHVEHCASCHSTHGEFCFFLKICRKRNTGG